MMGRMETTGWVELLAERPAKVAGLARRLRAAALTAMPDLTERYYAGWQGLGLRHPRGGLIATIFPRDGDVIVYFERGASLPDPHGMLRGEGRLRQTRTIVFEPRAKAPTQDHLVVYLDLAVEHALATRAR